MQLRTTANLSVAKEQIKAAESGIAQQDIEEILRRRHNLGKHRLMTLKSETVQSFKKK